jgi:hypothetical protein
MSVVAHDVVDDVVVDDVVDDAVVNDHMAVVRLAAGRKGQECGYQNRARRGRQAEPMNHHVFPPIQTSRRYSGSIRKIWMSVQDRRDVRAPGSVG